MNILTMLTGNYIMKLQSQVMYTDYMTTDHMTTVHMTIGHMNASKTPVKDETTTNSSLQVSNGRHIVVESVVMNEWVRG